MNGSTYSSCSYCGGAVDEQHVRLEMWFGESLVVFENVPAGVCDNCGEEYFRADVQDKMTALMKTAPKKRMQVPVYSFSDPLTVAKTLAAQKKKARERAAETEKEVHIATDEEISELFETDIEDWEEQ